jgi:dolichol-phosphate mannosyltransferase
MTYTVVIPVLNEGENLRLLIPILLKYDCNILICDNGSTDGSVEYTKSIYSTSSIEVSEGRGKVWDAVLRGIKLAKTDSIVVMDADFSHPPEFVSVLTNYLDSFNLVVGRRISSDSFSNKLISGIGNFLSIGLCPDMKDRMSGFWAFNKTALRSNTLGPGPKPMLEFLVKSEVREFLEIPYPFSPRLNGVSKLGRSSSLYYAMVQLIRLYFFKYRKIVKFLIVGGIGVGINLGFLYALTEWANIWYMLSSSIGILIATFWNFVMNNLWTFGDRDIKGVAKSLKDWYK